MKVIIVLFAVLLCATVYAESEKCITSAGYSWCAKENKCVRPWELASEKGISFKSPKEFSDYCNSETSGSTTIGTKDENGCVTGAGYSWCSKENKCIRPWELASQVGIAVTPASVNAYCADCSVSAGYSWCEKEMKCVRPWELATLNNIENTPEAFKSYCEQTVTHPMGGGSDSHGCVSMGGYTWCQTENKCIRPWELSKEKNFTGNMEQNVQEYCSGSATQSLKRTIGGASDTHGCIAGAGYSWCETEGKCVRPWELAAAKQIENTPSAFQSYCNHPMTGQVGPDGCVAGAGYTWCAKANMCVRPWMLAHSVGFENTVEGFTQYCSS